MKKINCYSITRIKPLLYTTILIILFMIIIPIISIEGKINLEPNEYIEDQGVSMQTSAEVNTDIYINGDEKIKVYRTLQDKIEEVDLEEYICGVVANEMQVSFEDEALKAQAIAARTYLASKRIKNCTKANGADICDSTHCQAYTSKAVRLELWSDDVRDEYWSKISEAVNATKGQVLSYEGELVLYPQFFSAILL